MDTVALNKAETKVIAKARTWVHHRKAAQVAPARQQRQAQGRYEASSVELAEAVEKLDKAGNHG